MKKLLIIALSLILSLSLMVGCTTEIKEGTSGTSGTTGTTGTTGTGTSSGSSSDDEMTDDSYTVTLQFPSSVTVLPALTGIYAIWSNDSSVYSAEFNSSGVAYCNGLDGEYRVTLSETPDGYTYNPNIYEAEGGTDGRNVDIYMYVLSSFGGGSGAAPQQGIRASINTTTAFNVFRIEFNASDTEYYFSYTPATSGTYSIETYVSTYENTVNPTLRKYANTSYWNTWSETTDGGESGTYTKNVLATYNYAPSNQGGSWMLSIKIDCSDNVYPKYVDFAITWLEEYTDADLYAQYGGAYESVAAENVKEEGDGWETPSGDYTMLLDSSLMDSSFSYKMTVNGASYTVITYNETEDFYYYCKDPEAYYAATGGSIVIYDSNEDKNNNIKSSAFEQYWTLLFVQIKDTYFSYQGNSFSYLLGLLQAKTDPETGLGSGYMYRVSVKINGKLKNYNYKTMLETYQKAIKNTDGVYPVNDQLMNCLYAVSYTNTYFYDGKGVLEGYGYSSTDEAQWLYGCGVYI